MEHLKLAWTYRFWIAMGIVVLMPIVGFFVDSRTLAKSAEAKAGILKSIVTQLEGLKKAGNPNDQWATGVGQLKDVLSGQVDVAWVDLYNRQMKFKDWPKQVETIYLNAGLKGEDKVDQFTKVDYQNLYPPQLFDLVGRVQPVGWKGSKGLVEMNPETVFKYRPYWAAENQPVPPTVREAWLAQEEIWLLRAALDVVTRANKDSTKWQESPVKRILDIRIGGDAADATLSSKGAKEQLVSPEGELGAAASKTGKGRYIKSGSLFVQVPIYMQLIVDQRKIVEVLSEFGNSDIPMLVKQVEILQMTEKPGASTTRAGGAAARGGEEGRGQARLKEDEFFHMTQLDVWSRAFFFNPPPETALAAVKAKEQAAAQAPPATPAETKN